MLQDDFREPQNQTDRTNTAWHRGCTPRVPDVLGARGAWMPSNSASGQLHQTTTQPVCSCRGGPDRPAHTNPRCGLMGTVTPATPLAIWGVHSGLLGCSEL